MKQQATEGTFVSHGQHDILTVATGKTEHPGRVRAAGRGHSIRSYFGSTPSSSQSSASMDQLFDLRVSQVVATYVEKFKVFQEELEKKMYDDMQKKLEEHM